MGYTLGGTAVGVAKDSYSGVVGTVGLIAAIDNWIKDNVW
jgi:hypothetical protein